MDMVSPLNNISFIRDAEFFDINVTTLSPNVNETEDWSLDVAYVTLELLAALVTTVGNACVIVVFLKYRSMRSVTNYYVLSLAVADLLVGMIAVPFAIVTSVELPKLFEACLFMNSLLMALCTSSIFSLVALSIDRYIAIIYPLHYKTTMTAKHSLIAIFTSWVLAIIVGLLPLFGWNLGPPPVPRCRFTEVIDLTYLLFIYAATIILPSVFISVVYAKIFWVVHKHVSVIISFRVIIDFYLILVRLNCVHLVLNVMLSMMYLFICFEFYPVLQHISRL